jgi:hypothetical protein
MRKLLLALLFAALPALAQYGPSGNPVGNSAVRFQPLAKTSAIAASTTSASIAFPATAIIASPVIAGTAGQFTCTCSYLTVGMVVTITGTYGGTGSISGYASGNQYVLTAVGTNSFTLAQTNYAPLVTTTGTPTGLTFSALNAIFVDTATTQQAQIVNTTNGVAFVIFCATSSCTASIGSTGTSTSDFPVGPNSTAITTFPTGVTYVAVILNTGATAGTVFITPGIGI